MIEIKIDQEFKSLIPPLTNDEYSQLESNCKEEGIRDPLIVWGNTLVDGHNRYEIALKENLSFKVEQKDFEDREAVKMWIIRNQLGRRNLSAYDRSILALKLKPKIAEKAKENEKLGGKGSQKSVDHTVDTQKELAKIAGVSHDTIHKVEKIEEKATPKTKQLIREGKLSINQAYNSVMPKKKTDPVKTAKKEHEEFKSQKVTSITDVKNDKINKRIISTDMVQRLIKLVNGVIDFASECKDDYDEIKEFYPDGEMQILKAQCDICKKIFEHISESLI